MHNQITIGDVFLYPLFLPHPLRNLIKATHTFRCPASCLMKWVMTSPATTHPTILCYHSLTPIQSLRLLRLQFYYYFAKLRQFSFDLEIVNIIDTQLLVQWWGLFSRMLSITEPLTTEREQYRRKREIVIRGAFQWKLSPFVSRNKRQRSFAHSGRNTVHLTQSPPSSDTTMPFARRRWTLLSSTRELNDERESKVLIRRI